VSGYFALWYVIASHCLSSFLKWWLGSAGCSRSRQARLTRLLLNFLLSGLFNIVPN
jgi:hypothetical protein